MRPLVLFLCLIVPGLAAAQIAPTINLDVGGVQNFPIGAGNCSDQITVNWNVANVSVSGSCGGMDIWASTRTCDTTNGPTGSDQLIGTVSQNTMLSQTTGSFTFAVTKLPIFSTSTGVDGGTSSTTACGDATEKSANICARLGYVTSIYSGGCTFAPASSTPTVNYDALPPDVPSITNVEGLDSALMVTVSSSSDAQTVRVEYQDPATGNFVTGVDIPFSSTDTGRIEGLTNGVTYNLQALAIDAAGNTSATSTPTVPGTPLHTEGFWDRYKELGGTESGGCEAAGGGLVAWAALVAARLISRRRR